MAVSWFVLYAYNSANVMFEINEVRNKSVIKMSYLLSCPMSEIRGASCCKQLKK